jgi:hypothetical protein
MNLHIYIPGLSAHPDGCLWGKIQRTLLLATKYPHQTALMASFTTHLKNRGHTLTEIESIILEAGKRIDRSEQSNNNKTHGLNENNGMKTVYVHWQFHLCDMVKNQSEWHNQRPSWALMVLTK